MKLPNGPWLFGGAFALFTRPPQVNAGAATTRPLSQIGRLFRASTS
jgi:hypothetical protein